jgi:hypothetical protein
MRYHEKIIVGAVLILLAYAIAYMLMSASHFSSNVNLVDGLYLSTLLITTCGVDTIHPTTDFAKLVCCSEMIVGFLIAMHLLSISIVGMKGTI